MEGSSNNADLTARQLQEIRNSATEWNLGGDRNLLNLLEGIHKDVITNIDKTNEKHSKLSVDLNKTSTLLMNINNRFSELCNTQFIENKVQEDEIIVGNDSVSCDNIIRKPQDKKTDNQPSEQVIKAVSDSLLILKELCDEIEDSDSESIDSDTENADSRIILKPKDLYADSHLPHIIGSQKWKNKWHIGLEECSSESDSDEAHSKHSPPDEYSSSDESEKESNREDQDSLCNKRPMSLPIVQENRPSIVRDEDHDDDDDFSDKIDFSKSSNKTITDIKQEESHAPQTRIAPSDFAAELARKLGSNVIPQTNVVTKPVKPKDVMKPSTKPLYNPGLSEKPATRVTGNIISDEPPPIETSDKSNMFTDSIDDYVSTGLFGDDPGTSTRSSGSPNSFFGSSDVFNKKPISNYSALFDDIPDDDIFSNKKPVHKTRTDDSDIFASNDQSIQKTRDVPAVKPEMIKKPDTIKSKIKTTVDEISLFDDDADSDDNLFGAPKANPVKKTQETDSMFSSAIKKTEARPTKVTSLFDDISDSDDDLFGSRGKKKTNAVPATKHVEVVKNVPVKKVEEVKSKLSSTIAPKPTSINPLPGNNSIQNQNTTNIEPQQETKNVKDTKNIEHQIIEQNKHVQNIEQPIVTKNTEYSSNIDKQSEIIKQPVGISKDSKVSIKPEEPPKPKKLFNSNISNGLFDDVPPPLDDTNTIDIDNTFMDDDDDLFNTSYAPAKSKKSDNAHSSSGGLFDSNYNKVDLFSDEPPDIFGDEPPAIPTNDEEYSDIYADYPYYKTVNIVENSKKINKTEEPKKKEPEQKSTDKQSLFSESDDEELFKTVKIQPVESKKPSLFDDISDDSLSNTGATMNDNSNFVKVNVTKPKVIPRSEVVKNNVKPTKTIAELKAEIKPNLTVKSDDLTTENEEQSINPNAKADNSLKPNKDPVPDIPKKPNLDSVLEKPVDLKLQKNNEEPDGLLFSKPPAEKSDEPVEVSPQRKINKLNMNLNINVQALLPGGMKTVKSISNDLKNTPPLSPVVPNAIEITTETSRGFDDPNPSSNTLSNSVLKDRVKIQVKRRPPTRKAIHEAARRSVADIYNIESEPESKKEFIHSLPNSPLKEQNPPGNFEDCVPKTDEIDRKPVIETSIKKEEVKISTQIKIEPQLKEKIKENTPTMNISENKTVKNIKPEPKLKESRNLFSDSDSDSELFGSKKPNVTKINKKSVPNKPTDSLKGIFDDDGDDLFKTSQTKPPNNKVTKKPTEKSLFDDNSDDEFDIFNTKKETKPTVEKREVVKKLPKTKAEDAKETFEDPLFAFLN